MKRHLMVLTQECLRFKGSLMHLLAEYVARKLNDLWRQLDHLPLMKEGDRELLLEKLKNIIQLTIQATQKAKADIPTVKRY